MMRNIAKGVRGRPSSPWESHYDMRLFTYILRISQKHRVSPEKFLKKIAEARENEKSEYRTLTIQCRWKKKNQAMYRITKKGNLLAQLRIPNYLLDSEGKLKIKDSIMKQAG